jgi:uncharacterized protein (TIGR02300 family)
VSKPEWGTKRICQSCGAKFYDFNASPIVCPACGTQFDPEAFLKSRRAKPVKEKEPPKKPAPEYEEEEEESIAESGDDELVPDEDEDSDNEDIGSEVAVEDDDKE